MATYRELEAYIRFQLDQLSVRNAHHEFEHMCRHLVRARICSNILPATGPVAAGGDQGRDFESYEAQVQDPLGTSSFVGLMSDRRLAFACTLQKAGIDSKIKRNVSDIMGSGQAVNGIYFLCSTDIPVSRRHALRDWARSEHSVALEIHDGQWIAQELCQKDVFGIAQEYLGVPRELYPDLQLDDESYRALYRRWEEATPGNLAEFLEVRAGLREAAAKDGPNQDLTFWLERVAPDVLPTPLRKHAIYETLVASLRGRRSMEGLESIVREYFSNAAQLERTSDLDDAAVLLGFCVGASGVQCLDLPVNKLREYARTLLERTEELLQGASSPGYRARLLLIRSSLVLFAGPSLDSLDGCLNSWAEALDLVDKAPLFPLGVVGDLINQFIDLLPTSEHGRFMPRLLALAKKTDELIEKRYGAFTAAGRCRDRGMTLYNKGELLGAIEQFHRAKKGWFAEETLRGSILSILFLSKCYSELGLRMASKYYALAGAYMASVASDLGLRRYVPQGLFMAADYDYALGAWCSYLLLVGVGLRAFAAYGIEKDPSSIESEINRALFHSGIIYAMSRHFAPQLRKTISEAITGWDLADDLDDLLQVADKQWANEDIPAIENALCREHIQTPFCDIGSQRRVRFRALGIVWELGWENSFVANCIGEHFTSVLQILLADLAETDLCLIVPEVLASIVLGDVDPANTMVEGEHPGKWRITLPRSQEEEFDAAVFTAASGLLAHSSALPMGRMEAIVEQRLENALLGKTFCVQPYTQLMAAFVGEGAFKEFDRSAGTETATIECILEEHTLLAPPEDAGPGYDRDAHEEHIRNRYENLRQRLGGILAQLASSKEFRKVTSSLREEGWKDWHILLAVYNAVVNYLASMQQGAGNKLTHQERIARGVELAKLEVLPDDVPIPSSVVSEENLRQCLRHSMLSTLKTWGLTVNTKAIDPYAIEKLLSERYGYWTDDVPHEDLGI